MNNFVVWKPGMSRIHRGKSVADLRKLQAMHIMTCVPGGWPASACWLMPATGRVRCGMIPVAEVQSEPATRSTTHVNERNMTHDTCLNERRKKGEG